MATLVSPTSEAGRLTAAFQTAQSRRAATMAALVVAYYRTRVDVEDPSSIEAWLRIMVPRILREHNLSATQAALFANTLRRLEVPDAPRFSFTPSVGAVEEQVRRSLLVVGPEAYKRRAAVIRRDPEISPVTKQALIRDLDKATETKIGGAVARHTQNGARQTISDGVKEDRVALGFVRVTRDEPCYFCAMLASRGLVFAEDSFDMSDPRFTGRGTAKVHDHCQCHLKPVYDRDGDDYLKRADYFEGLWREFSTGSTAEAIRTFRNGYNTTLSSVKA